MAWHIFEKGEKCSFCISGLEAGNKDSSLTFITFERLSLLLVFFPSCHPVNLLVIISCSVHNKFYIFFFWFTVAFFTRKIFDFFEIKLSNLFTFPAFKEVMALVGGGAYDGKRKVLVPLTWVDHRE